MSLTSYQAAPPCNMGVLNVGNASKGVNGFLQVPAGQGASGPATEGISQLSCRKAPICSGKQGEAGTCAGRPRRSFAAPRIAACQPGATPVCSPSFPFVNPPLLSELWRGKPSTAVITSIARRPLWPTCVSEDTSIIMNITVKDLLDAGVHFGHQTKRWNPRSKPYIFDHRQGVSIIDLGKTHAALQQACEFAENLVGDGGVVLMVGTKRQAQEIVREAATGTGMPYCVNRWLGGTLTNFATIKRSIGKFKAFQQMETSGEMAKLPKKEESAIKREMARMQRNFDGILDMDVLPGALFVIDAPRRLGPGLGGRCSARRHR